METNKRKAISDKLNKYCTLANENDFIEVTEWTNGEGWDITLNGKPVISLTYGELEAINFLTKAIDVVEK